MIYTWIGLRTLVDTIMFDSLPLNWAWELMYLPTRYFDPEKANGSTEPASHTPVVLPSRCAWNLRRKTHNPAVLAWMTTINLASPSLTTSHLPQLLPAIHLFPLPWPLLYSLHEEPIDQKIPTFNSTCNSVRL